ncbi:MAG: aminotransferase class III-fold pyridoxal phosphate-dependent enzyme [Candidatus Zixiibacteriota bacterium]|nr:MAG: aminotransferase class III-fold pyridoxal phosphate-dependent enzyme [candidate division Zixibacteria bacterium]
MKIVRPDRPSFTVSEAVGVARELFGLSAAAKELPSERDQNFHLKAESGDEFVLKIAGEAETKEGLEFQNAAMERVLSRTGSGCCPQACPSLTGEQITETVSTGGIHHYVRLLTYLPGDPLSMVRSDEPELLHSLGVILGQIDRALLDFAHPVRKREFHWDLSAADEIIRRYQREIPTQGARELVQATLETFLKDVKPRLSDMRTGFIHNDANDHNVITSFVLPDEASIGGRRATGIVDFGDAVHSQVVNELAVAVAYVMLDKADPLAAAAHVVSGFHQAFPLEEREIELVFPLACTRLALSVTIAAHQKALEPDNQYLIVTEQSAWTFLRRLKDISADFAHYCFRHACGLPPCPEGRKISQVLSEMPRRIYPLLSLDLRSASITVLDLSVGSPELGNLADEDVWASLDAGLAERQRREDSDILVGRYGETRLVEPGQPERGIESKLGQDGRTSLGIDLMVAADCYVTAPLSGTIHHINTAGDNTLILQHRTDDDVTFFTIYRGLEPVPGDDLKTGRHIKAGARIGRVESFRPDTSRHLHFQIVTDLLHFGSDFPTSCPLHERDIRMNLCPDPNLMLRIPEEVFPPPPRTPEAIVEARHRMIGTSLSISYRRPLKIVRGAMQYLYDEDGRAYLDAVNNVPHVGHNHPAVVKAVRRQMEVLNTNTRYLHDNLVEYAERLTATMPEPLSVCYFVNSGSEANELALRLARTHTNKFDIITVGAAYHGNSSNLIDISPYKFEGPGGKGPPEHVHKVVMPDLYRGPYRTGEKEPGKKYAGHVVEALEAAHDRGRQIAAFFCESLLGCGGQIVLPDGYLAESFHHVRQSGGVCVADEVQVGFGRVGTHFWGFETQGVVPDIVTLGKPMGNGHPLAAVVTTAEIADSFDTGMEYFNTFGGNPVSCAAGLAVLAVIEEENLQHRALEVGSHLKEHLKRLMEKHQIIGDVRGLGLFVGVELVRDRSTLEPAKSEAVYVIEKMKDQGILISTDGPYENVLKIKPPLQFSKENADQFVSVLDTVLSQF